MVTQLGFRILITFSIIFLLGINLSTAQEPYFKGKTIRIIAGFPGGGGVDAESRMLARFLPAAVPGNPTIVVQNMPGAGAHGRQQLVRTICQARRFDASLQSRAASISRRWALKRPNMIFGTGR